MTRFEELVEKLSDLFELEKADLDFGIHGLIERPWMPELWLTPRIAVFWVDFGSSGTTDGGSHGC